MSNKMPHGLTAAALLEGLRKIHLGDEGDYYRYVEQKLLESLTNTLSLLEVVRTTDDSIRISETAEGLATKFLDQILCDIDEWKKESEGGSNVAIQK